MCLRMSTSTTIYIYVLQHIKREKEGRPPAESLLGTVFMVLPLTNGTSLHTIH